MRKEIARLIDCGIPRQVAVCVCNDFRRRKKLEELESYIQAVENECSGRDEFDD